MHPSLIFFRPNLIMFVFFVVSLHKKGIADNVWQTTIIQILNKVILSLGGPCARQAAQKS